MLHSFNAPLFRFHEHLSLPVLLLHPICLCKPFLFLYLFEKLDFFKLKSSYLRGIPSDLTLVACTSVCKCRELTLRFFLICLRVDEAGTSLLLESVCAVFLINLNRGPYVLFALLDIFHGSVFSYPGVEIHQVFKAEVMQ